MIPRLCYVSDGPRATGGRPLAEVIRSAARGGVGMVILRERSLPDAELGALLEHLEAERRAGLEVLISRRLDLARGYGLEGVHLGKDAISTRLARAWLGPRARIGYSAHSGEEARRAAEEGASYVMLSPIYPTGSKPGHPGRGPRWLTEASRSLAVPVLALGGLTPARAGEALRAGAWGIAAASAIGAAADPERAAREFQKAMTETH